MAQEVEIKRVGEDRSLEELLEPNQLAALETLLSGRSVVEAAEEAEVSRQTVHR